jgi:transposase
VRKIETHDWWPQLVELKDELTLQELAERFGVTAQAVARALKRTGTSRTPTRPGPRSGRSSGAGQRKPVASGPKPRNKSHLIEPFEHLLGKITDGEVAEMAGVGKGTVANYRARAGIPAHPRGPKPAAAKKARSSKAKGSTRKASKRRKARPSKVDPFVALLGNVPDGVVAEKAGVTVGAVQHYRARLGIPSTRARKATTEPPAAPPSATPKGSPANGMLAWRVTLAAGDVMVVAAETLAAAAARSATLGDVVALERVGKLV